jgi:hypothetical protein
MKSFDKYFMTQSKPQDAKSSNEQSYFAFKGVDGSFCGGRGVGSSQAGRQGLSFSGSGLKDPSLGNPGDVTVVSEGVLGPR